MKNVKSINHCKKENKDSIYIDIYIRSANDIFSNYDMVFTKEESINKELEDFILNSLDKYPLNKDIKLIFHISDHKTLKDNKILQMVIHNHFSNKVIETELYLIQKLKQWSINMLIGVLFLILCFILAEIFNNFTYIKLVKVIKESLSIIGWVALWEPINFILFELRDIKKDILLHKKLRTIPVCLAKHEASINNFISKTP